VLFGDLGVHLARLLFRLCFLLVQLPIELSFAHFETLELLLEIRLVLATLLDSGRPLALPDLLSHLPVFILDCLSVCGLIAPGSLIALFSRL